VTLSDLATISNIGGWCFGALVAGVFALGFVRGEIVAGRTYRRECGRVDDMVGVVEAITSALESNTDISERMSGQVDTLLRLWGGER